MIKKEKRNVLLEHIGGTDYENRYGDPRFPEIVYPDGYAAYIAKLKEIQQKIEEKKRKMEMKGTRDFTGRFVLTNRK